MNEDFLTRWSRRKRDVAETEQAKVPDESPHAGAPGEHDTIAGNGIPENAEAVEPVDAIGPPAFDLTSLPSIESITAATDIRPFLAPGVPADIARAALRRAWSSDPRIRDFVGLADYDWDYHTPGSAAGFGPLEMTDELRRMVARILGDIVDTDTPKRPDEPATGTECVEEPLALGAEVKLIAPGNEIPPSLDRPMDHAGSVIAVETTASAALQHVTPQDELPRSPIRRGHGRALPK
jgi:Protein of unknown function (DUF3306)